MSIPENEVAANNQRRRMEETSKSPVGGVIESAVNLARPGLAVGAAVIASGASSATGIAVAGSVVAGLGIVDWFRKLGSDKVNENLEALGQATEDALNRVEATLRAHGTSLDEINRRLNSPEFKDGMTSAALQALRTSQQNRLKRLALILANGIKENDLNSESFDDMMRAAVSLTGADIELVREMYTMQSVLFSEEWIRKSINERANHLSFLWSKFWETNHSRFQGLAGIQVLSSFSRLQSLGLIGPGPDRSSGSSPAFSCCFLLPEGKRLIDRLRAIG